jgi:hypothetical protein
MVRTRGPGGNFLRSAANHLGVEDIYIVIVGNTISFRSWPICIQQGQMIGADDSEHSPKPDGRVGSAPKTILGNSLHEVKPAPID